MAKDKMIEEAKEEVKEHGGSDFGKKVAKKVLGGKKSSMKAKIEVFGMKKGHGKKIGGK